MIYDFPSSVLWRRRSAPDKQPVYKRVNPPQDVFIVDLVNELFDKGSEFPDSFHEKQPLSYYMMLLSGGSFHCTKSFLHKYDDDRIYQSPLLTQKKIPCPAGTWNTGSAKPTYSKNRVCYAIIAFFPANNKGRYNGKAKKTESVGQDRRDLRAVFIDGAE